jgi:uncharacterized membrane protein
MPNEDAIMLALRLAGAGQIAFGLLYPLASRALDWPDQARRVRPINARIFLTLFLYISAINLAFGLLGLLAPRLLLDGTTLATLLLAFIAAYWSVRTVLQLVWYRWSEVDNWVGSAPARAALTGAVAFFAAAHLLALAHVLTK